MGSRGFFLNVVMLSKKIVLAGIFSRLWGMFYIQGRSGSFREKNTTNLGGITLNPPPPLKDPQGGRGKGVPDHLTDRPERGSFGGIL